jgi:hypothetical protein
VSDDTRLVAGVDDRRRLEDLVGTLGSTAVDFILDLVGPAGVVLAGLRPRPSADMGGLLADRARDFERGRLLEGRTFIPAACILAVTVHLLLALKQGKQAHAGPTWQRTFPFAQDLQGGN